MEQLALRIIEKILILYFILYLLIDIILFLYAIIVFRRKKQQHSGTPIDYREHSVSILVPAYNESVSIVDCTKMLLNLNYPDYEVIVINDGSSDTTLEELMQHFSLETADRARQSDLSSRAMRAIYRSPDQRLTVIDKENGGKADSINAGINYSEKTYVCTIDADSILDAEALKEIVTPFILDKHTTVSGGQLAAANGIVLSNNKVVSSSMPKNIWVVWQIVEYIKSFLVSRIGLSKINALLVMSGAFSLFRKSDLLAVGGFLTKNNDHPYILQHVGRNKQTVCEDMEVVVRLFKYKRDLKQKTKVVFLPRPVCWTEVPDNARNLYRQRSRWHQGLTETLSIHRSMIFEPRYKATGLVGLPYYLFFELMAPVMKVFAILFVIIASIISVVNYYWLLLFLLGAILLTTIITTTLTALIENWSIQQTAANRDALRYKNFGNWIWLITASVIGELYYSFFKIFAQINGILNAIRKQSNWMKFERKGVESV